MLCQRQAYAIGFTEDMAKQRTGIVATHSSPLLVTRSDLKQISALKLLFTMLKTVFPEVSQIIQ